VNGLNCPLLGGTLFVNAQTTSASVIYGWKKELVIVGEDEFRILSA
jgi:hypothetical protein